MTSHHIPSPSLLRYLARLTRPSRASQTFLPLQQQRPFSHSDKCSVQKSTKPRSPRARKAAREIGSSFAAANYGYDNYLDAFQDVLLSKWVISDFAVLGLAQPDDPSKFLTPQAYIVDEFLGTMKNGNSPLWVAGWFLGTTATRNSKGQTFKEGLLNCNNSCLKPLANLWIMSNALWVLGYQFVMSDEKVQRELGQYMVKVAVIMGSVDAIIHVIWSHHRGGAIEPTLQTRKALNDIADHHENLDAMCVRAETLAWPYPSTKVATPAQRTQAYELALNAFWMSEPDKPFPPPPPPRIDAPVAAVPEIRTIITPAWQILQRLGGPNGKLLPPSAYAVWKAAVVAGAAQYDDPEACLLAIDPASALLPVGSPKWVTFAMKAAMAGKAIGSLRLGQYYLELHNWYPPNLTLRGRDKIGFHWVEVSIAQMVHPPEIQVNVFAMALLCRENGEGAEARRWLDVGVERIEEVKGTKGVDLGECLAVMGFLEECKNEDWGVGAEMPRGWTVEETYFPDKLLGKAMVKRGEA